VGRLCDVTGVSADDSLVGVLTSLAAETTDDRSHDDVSRELTVEDVDAMLSQVMMPLSAEDQREIVEESLEMSQRVWDEDVQPAADAATTHHIDNDDDDDMYVIQQLVLTVGLA